MNFNKIRRFLFLPLFIVNCPFLFSLDFGLALNQNLRVPSDDSKSGFKYSVNLVPRVSGLLGENADYCVSVGIEAAYQDEWSFIPELLRTEFAFRFRALSVSAGRIYHSDPLGLIAAGLFDGVGVSYDSSLGSFHAGVWYTGLLYKKRLNIEMTADDYALTNSPLNTDGYAGTYFAPKRLVSSLGWEHYSLLGGVMSASAALLGQFDLSSGEALNSQYLAVKAAMPLKDFDFELGACLQLNQLSGEFGTGFMAELGIGYEPEIALKSRISFLARYASGSAGGGGIDGGGIDGGGIDAFIPVTTIRQGNVLEAKLSGITMVTLDYTARFLNALSAGVGSSYFMRNGLSTYGGYPLGSESGDGYLLGNEFFARVFWSPFSDIHVNLGGGIFLPSMGDASPNADVNWRVELNIILLLY